MIGSIKIGLDSNLLSRNFRRGDVPRDVGPILRDVIFTWKAMAYSAFNTK